MRDGSTSLLGRVRAWATRRAHLFDDPDSYLAGVDDALGRVDSGLAAQTVPQHPAGGARPTSVGGVAPALGVLPAPVVTEPPTDIEVARTRACAMGLAIAGRRDEGATAELRQIADDDVPVMLAARNQISRVEGLATQLRQDADRLLTLAATRPAPSDHHLETAVRSEHDVCFYETDATVVSAVTDFLAPIVRDAGTAVVVATADHLAAAEAALLAEGLDVAAARADGRYRERDAARTVDRILVDGQPDAARFRAVMDTLLDDLSDAGPVRIFGEMVGVLWERGQLTAALALEDLWNELPASPAFELFCAYPIGGVAASAAEDVQRLREVCDRHAAIVADAS